MPGQDEITERGGRKDSRGPRSRSAARRGFSAQARGVWLGGVVVAVLVAPLVVALLALRHPRYYPVGDLAEIELRVRDVGTLHPPLIGLVGRFGAIGREGSHPGPLGFWLLWPIYRLFGGSSWSLDVAVVSLHLVAVALIIWIAWRLGGRTLVLAMAGLLALLLHAYGSSMLTQAWTPYVPLLWWLVFLLAAWAVSCEDWLLLPLAVFAGSLCSQSHVGYVPMIAGLLVFALVRARIAARGRDGISSSASVRRGVLWGIAIFVVVWIPPVIEQLRYQPGNLSTLWDYFWQSPGTANGWSSGARVLLVHLNAWRVVAHQLPTNIPAPYQAARGVATGSLLPGIALLVAWTIAALGTWRTRLLGRLHELIAAVLVLQYVAMSRVIGPLYFWLVLWAWTTTMLMVLAIGWAIATRIGALRGHRSHAVSILRLALATLLVTWTTWFLVDATTISLQGEHLSRQLHRLIPSTIAALSAKDHSAHQQGRYLLTWTNPLSFDVPAIGILNELVRAGYDVGVDPIYENRVTPNYVTRPGSATATVHLAVGADMLRWRHLLHTRQVAYLGVDEPRRREYRRLRSRVIDDLWARGRAGVASNVDNAPLLLALDPRTPRADRHRLIRMLDIGLPTAIYVSTNPPADNPEPMSPQTQHARYTGVR